VVPRGVVVARPGRPEALAAGVGRARDGERPTLGRELAEAFERRPLHLHAVDVVGLGVRPALALEGVDHVVRQRRALDLGLHRALDVGDGEERGLVHVVPEPVDAGRQ